MDDNTITHRYESLRIVEFTHCRDLYTMDNRYKYFIGKRTHHITNMVRDNKNIAQDNKNIFMDMPIYG